MKRQGRATIMKAKSPPAKFPRKIRSRVDQSAFLRSPIDLHISQKKLTEPIEVSLETMKAMEVEVLDLVCSKAVSVSAMANALAGSARVIDRHGNQGALKTLVKQMKNLFLLRPKPGDDALKRRYELVMAMNRLEKETDATVRTVSTWEEAKEALSSVVKFPDEKEEAALEEKKTIEPAEDETKEKYARNLDEIFQKGGSDSLLPLTSKWKQVAAYPRSSKLGDEHGEDLGAHRTEVEKADNLFSLRLREAVGSLTLQSQAVRDIEERLLEKEREEEAEKRASSLMRPLTEEEREIVRNAMYGIGPGDEVLARAGSDFVQRSSIQTLQPGQWLNDEVIHHFYLMLSIRDEELCEQDTGKKRSHFFKSFFITKLLNEGHANPDLDGTYEYRNVKRWSKKAPGKDIFNLDKVFFPINEGRMHWLCGVADITNKRVQIYDSMGSNGTHYLGSIFRYLQDEHMDKKKTPLPDIDQWELVECERDTPRQRNGKCLESDGSPETTTTTTLTCSSGYDCGVFTCMFADFISKSCPLVFSQEHITQCRERIALSIMNGKAIM